jgi:hypothetical protein
VPVIFLDDSLFASSLDWHEGMNMESIRILRAGSACSWLISLLALMAAPAASAGEFDPSYDSDFSFPGTLDRWSITSGNWQLANNELRNTSTIPLSIATVPEYHTPFFAIDAIGGDLSLDVYFAIGSSAASARVGAVFEFTDSSNFHEVTLSPAGSVQLRTRIAGITSIIATATTTAPGANKWVHLKLVRANHRTTVRIDGVRVFDHVLQDGLQSADIGLLTRNTSARFDDLDARSYPAQIPTIEDFDDGVATSWTPLSGVWSAQSKAYVNTAVIHTAITQIPLQSFWDADGSPFEIPYTFKARMLNPYGGSGNLVGLAWVSSADNYTEAVFSPRGVASLNEVRSGVRTTVETAQYVGGGPNKWFEVEIEQDPTLPPEFSVGRIKVNGVVVFNTAPSIPGSGVLSLITHWAPGRFDDVRAAPDFFRSISANFDGDPAHEFRGWQQGNGMYNSSAVVASNLALIDDSYSWHELHDIDLRAKMINRFGNAGNLVGITYGMRASVYYEVVFSPTGVAQLRKVVKGAPIAIATASYEGGGRNQWFDAQLTQIGERTTVRVNGVPVFLNVPQPDALGGGLGFVAHWTNASIDDVQFQQVPPP